MVETFTLSGAQLSGMDKYTTLCQLQHGTKVFKNKWKCNECRVILSASEFNNHWREIDSGERCKVCHNLLTDDDYLCVNNILNNDDIITVGYKCTSCNHEVRY